MKNEHRFATRAKVRPQRRFVVIGMLAVVCLLAGSLVAAAQAADTSSDQLPRLVIEEKVYTFESVLDGEELVHDFVLKNTGNGPLFITGVRSG